MTIDPDELSFDEWDALQIIEWFEADPGAPVPASCKLLDYKYAHENPGAWNLVSSAELPFGISPEGARAMLETEALVQNRRSWTELRHPGHANQKVHGGGGKGKAPKLSDDKATELAGRLKEPDGGFTHDPRKGKDVTSGYAVAAFKDRSEEVPLADATPDRLKSYVDKNSDVLSKDGNMFGGWHDPASGNVWLDISTVTSSKDAAIKLGKQHNQIAIFDLSNFESIDTGGSGRSAPAAEQRKLSTVTRAIDKVGDNCPQCQANEDPAAVPVHPGCNCDTVTADIELGLDADDLPDLPVTAQLNTAAALDRSSFRWTDFHRWMEKVASSVDDLSAVSVLMEPEGEDSAVYLFLANHVENNSIDTDYIIDKLQSGALIGRLRGGSTAAARELFDEIMGGGR